jgi:hypothetical protein
MYITITAQKLDTGYSQSATDFVAYLEKENQGLEQEDMEHFFNQHGDAISSKEVIQQLDGNTAKLKKVEPKFYSITINPSKSELRRLEHSKQDLKRYTREVMKDYVTSFHREIDGRPIQIDDIKYFAKIEQQRTYKGTDKQVQENQPFATKILHLKNEIRSIQRGELEGDIKNIEQKINALEQAAPHLQNGNRIVQGMQKEGNQSHIHIIVSRKDASNSVSLSPGTKYKASEVMMNGKLVKRGFDRDAFFHQAEKTFDKTFGFERNYTQSYQSKKDFIKDPKLYFSTILRLPASEKAIAFKVLARSGVPILSLPTNKAQLVLSVIRKLKRGVDVAIRSGSIGI